MNSIRSGLLWASLISVCGWVDSAVAQQAERIRFATEYVRELIEIETIRARAEAELKPGNTPGDRMADCIRNSEAFQLELQADTAMLRSLKLDGDVAGVPAQFAEVYEEKITLYKQLSGICSAFMAPEPNLDVNYGQLAALMPKITASLDFLDKALFDASPLVFAALVDTKPDAENHLSRLIITRSERDALLSRINSGFGSKLDAKNQNWTVSAAWVLREYITKKGYKLADDP